MKLLLGCILRACLLGIAVDLVTAHVAVEYFTVHHPHLLDTTEPIPIALAWGVVASWWFGALVGGVLLVAKWRIAPPPTDAWMLRFVSRACVVIWGLMMAILAAVYGLTGFIPAAQRRATFEFDRRIMAVALAHQFEYLFGGIALVVLLVRMVREARRSRQALN